MSLFPRIRVSESAPTLNYPVSTVVRLIKAGTWLTIANLVTRILSSLTLPLLARLLGPSALGIYSIVFATAQTGQSISSLGAEVVMHRNGAQYKTIGAESVGRLFGVGMAMVCIMSALCGLIVFIFRVPLAVHWLGRPELSTWLGIAALIILIQPLGAVPLFFLASLQDFRSFALRTSLGVFFSSAVTVALPIWSFLMVRPVLRDKAIRLS